MLPHKRRRFWLDDLPPDVCERIAFWVGRTYISQSYAVDYSTSLLQLAEASHAQRSAVISLLRNKFELTNRTALHVERWCCVFWSRMRCLQVDVDRSDLVHTFVHSPSLHRMIIRDDWNVIWAARFATTSLRSLQINLHHVVNVRPVLLLMSCLNLCELQMHCHSSRDCYFIRLQREGSKSLSFPRLVSAELCCNGHQSHDDILVWPFFGHVPTLRNLKFACGPKVEVRPHSLPQLAALDSLEMAQGLHGLRLAEQIGHSITKVCSLTDAVDAIDISRLSACPRLSSLLVRINPGAEVALPSVVSSLRALRATVSRERNELLGAWWHGLMLNIVVSAKNLRYFDVRGVGVSEEELVAILKHMGSRLEGFCTSAWGQGEAPWKRLLKIMKTLSEHNGSLKIFHGDFHSTDVEEVSDTDAKELVDALHHLRKRAPGLKIDKYCTANLVRFIVKHQSGGRRCHTLTELERSFTLEESRMGMGQRPVVSVEVDLENA